MNQVTADSSLQALLGGLTEPVEIRDASGKVLGYYTPLVGQEQRAEYERLVKLFDLEEARRVLAIQRDQGRPLKEVMERLRSLENSG